MNNTQPARRSLFQQFMLRLALPVLIAFALASLGTAWIAWQMQGQKAIEQQKNILSAFSQALTKPLWDCDNSTAQGIAVAITHLPRVYSVRISERCQQQTLQAGERTSAHGELRALSQAVEYLDEHGREHSLGELEVIFEPASVASVLVDNLWRYLVLLGVFLSMVVAAALLVFRRIISAPLQRFQQAIDSSKTTEGNLTLLETEMHRHNNELGDVMRGYDELMLQLDLVISELREKKDELQLLAHRDPLTGLGNRLELEDALERGLARVRRGGSSGHVLLLDLNDFKGVNDTWGHSAGDYMLQQVAQRLCEAVRVNDTVVRLGGDEFVIVAEALSSDEDLNGLCQKITRLISEPVEFKGWQLRVGVSIGAAKFPDDGDTSAVLLALADKAMYGQKRSR